MRYLLDTSICVELIRPGRGDSVRRRIDSLGDQDVAIPVIARMELMFGALRSDQQDQNTRVVRELLAQFPEVAFDARCADVAAEIWFSLASAGQLIGPADIQIAATAKAYGLIVVTGNVREFSRVKALAVEDWTLA